MSESSPPPTPAEAAFGVDPDHDRQRVKVRHLSPTERAARGRAARRRVPRSQLAAVDFGADRPDPIALLESQSASRVPDLVPIRYGRMMATPFTFYRGAALVMASDLSRTPHTDLTVQACGDAHLSNFGAFASPERSLIFDINDFDETNPGPWEWDLKRLVASLEIAGRDRSFSAKERKDVVLAAARQYRESMASLAQMGQMELWYTRMDADMIIAGLGQQINAKERKRVARNVAKAHSRDSMQAFRKFTAIVDGQRQIVSQPPLIVNVRDLMAGQGVDPDIILESVRGVLGRYRETLTSDRRHLLEQFTFTDLARKVVGVGSVGTRAWMALFLGRDNDDPLFLQVKEAQPSVLEAFTERSEFANMGERVVAGQRLMQSASDIFLGWDRARGPDGIERDFYVRQLRDWKGSADIETMNPIAMRVYGRMCGFTLAKAHARSGDPIAISSYLGKSDAMDRAIAEFSDAYADQNERDQAALVAAVRTGRLTADEGV